MRTCLETSFERKSQNPRKFKNREFLSSQNRELEVLRFWELAFRPIASLATNRIFSKSNSIASALQFKTSGIFLSDRGGYSFHSSEIAFPLKIRVGRVTPIDAIKSLWFVFSIKNKLKKNSLTFCVYHLSIISPETSATIPCLVFDNM